VSPYQPRRACRHCQAYAGPCARPPPQSPDARYHQDGAEQKEQPSVSEALAKRASGLSCRFRFVVLCHNPVSKSATARTGRQIIPSGKATYHRNAEEGSPQRHRGSQRESTESKRLKTNLASVSLFSLWRFSVSLCVSVVSSVRPARDEAQLIALIPCERGAPRSGPNQIPRW
jgi:hypothetical protein